MPLLKAFNYFTSEVNNKEIQFTKKKLRMKKHVYYLVNWIQTDGNVKHKTKREQMIDECILK